MSRIGKVPIPIPAGVSVDVKGEEVSVKGPKGVLTMPFRPEVAVAVEGNEALVTLSGIGVPREARAFHGLTRALIHNMVVGVSTGFSKKLEIHGVGWNCKTQGQNIVLNIGFCHPVEVPIPDGLEVDCPKATLMTISGYDRQQVGQLAAIVRAVRPPEPYKGKGIRYSGEYVRRRAGKSFGT
jgi:large subunit ribosomal protein L6